MKKAHVGVEGYDRRSLWADLILGAGSEFWQNNLNGTFKGFCRTGSLAGWMDPATTVGGTPLYGELLVKMPSQSSLKHKHTVSVTGTTHMVSTSSPFVHSTEVDTDDVTRTVTVTFTRL